MSSSSSLAAARRRRVGSQTVASAPQSGRGPTPGRGMPPPQLTKESVPDNSRMPPNPLMILQQHHIKINMLDEQIKQILNNQNISTLNSSPTLSPENISNDNLEENVIVQQKINLDEITELLMVRIEDQLDLKVFYDNDQKLAEQVDELNKIIIQQQTTMNNLNKLLYFIIHNLKLDFQEESTGTEEKEILDEENSLLAENSVNVIIGEHIENDSDELMITQQPTFTKAVRIDLESNEVTSFDSETESNYEPGTEFTEDGLAIPPVD